MQKILVIIILILSFTFGGFADDRALAKKDKTPIPRTALIIGNSDYVSSPLKNPVNDARAMSKVLKDMGFKVQTVLNGDQRSIKHAINEFGSEITDNKGVGLFYYAGHGMQTNGRNYLIPVDAVVETATDVEYEGVDVGRVLGKMETAKNSMNIVILDACRNNPFARSFRSADKGLATIDAPMGTFIAYATAPGSVAADGDGDNGLFTEALIDTIKKPNVAIEEVFKAVRYKVLSKSEGKQIPWQSSSLIGNFYFNADESLKGMAQPQPIIDFTEKKTVVPVGKNILVLPIDSENQIKCHTIFNIAWADLSREFRNLIIKSSACKVNYERSYEELDYHSGDLKDIWNRKNWYSNFELDIPKLHKYMKRNKYDFAITAKLLQEHALKYLFQIYVYDMKEDILYEEKVRVDNIGPQGSASQLYEFYKNAFKELSKKYNYALY